MRAGLGRLMRSLGRWLHRLQTPAHVDQMALRDEMTQADPDFARVRDVQHDAQQVLTAGGIADGLAIRREREFWERHGHQQRPSE